RQAAQGMVVIHIKKGDQSQFLFETTVAQPVDEFIAQAVQVYNGRLKIGRICDEISELEKHGLTLPPNMQGLTDEQVTELKLRDEWGEKCTPSGGFVESRDPIGRRNGRAPTENIVQVLSKTRKEARQMISKDLVAAGQAVNMASIQEALQILSGAMTIAYPMGLPPHEPIRMELQNEEDLSGTQASLEVIPPGDASAWFSGKEMQAGKLLSDYLGRNEKCKAIVKLAKRGQGPPAREPVVSEQEQKEMMAFYYRKQQEAKKLEESRDDSYMDSEWADSQQLRRAFHGLSDIKWGPK
ncbi:hypothetical protein BOX15_Mlig029277g1, partial [Macrostomum lignano]